MNMHKFMCEFARANSCVNLRARTRTPAPTHPHTHPHLQAIETLALLRLDGDLYQSTMEVLRGAYYKVRVVCDLSVAHKCDVRVSRGVGRLRQAGNGVPCHRQSRAYEHVVRMTDT